MGLFRGGLAVRRYRIVDHAVPKNKAELRRKLEKGAIAHHFVAVDPKGEHDRAMGWVAIDDLDVTELGDGRMFAGSGQSEVRLTLRIDRLVPPPVEVKRQLQQKTAALEASRGRPISRTEKKNLKQQIERTLRSKVFPQTRVHDLVWDLDEGTVLYWGQTKKAEEALIELFGKSFGLQLEIDGPSRWANQLLGGDVVSKLEPAPEMWQGFADVRPLSNASALGEDE